MDTETAEGRGRLCLAVLRMLLGWTFVWAFLDKMFGLGFPSTAEVAVINGGSPTEYYLSELVSGPFAGFWGMLAGNPVVDALLMFGLAAVGVSMMLGIASKLSTAGFFAMVLLMFTLTLPPGDNPLIDYHVIYLAACPAVYWLGGYSVLSLKDRWDGLGIVERFPLLG